MVVSGIKKQATAKPCTNCGNATSIKVISGSKVTARHPFIWYNREAVHHTQLTEVINPYNPISQQFFQTMGSFGLSEEQTASYLARQITAQGFIIGANEIFLVSATDWIVDLGPEGGSGGGQIIATGTPEEVAKVKGSHTARFLKDILAKG